MRALAASDYGDLSRLSVVTLPDPVPGPGEIVVRVAATSLNPVDLKSLSGALRALFETAFPYVPGVDCAGTVTAVGDGVTAYAPGDPVGGALHAGLAELTRASAASPLVAKVPAGLDLTVAAAAPVVGLAAMDALLAAGDVAGRTVAIVGASGGVGRIAAQLAAVAGARVIGTARAAEADAVRAAGAAEVIDYEATPAVDEIRRLAPGGADVVIDLVNVLDGLAASAAAVKPGGVLVSTLFGPPPGTLGAGVALRYVRMDEGAGATTAELYALLAGGRLRVDIARTYPFAEALDALRQLAAGSTGGKLVVTMP